jgi:hypothetical protein
MRKRKDLNSYPMETSACSAALVASIEEDLLNLKKKTESISNTTK